MHVVIEYEYDGEGHDGVAVKALHGPFDTERQAYEWIASRPYHLGGFGVEELSSVT